MKFLPLLIALFAAAPAHAGYNTTAAPATAPVQTYTFSITAAPYYAAGSSLTTTTTALEAAGATSIPVASAASFTANEGVLIGASGATPNQPGSPTTYVGRITAVSGNTLTISPALPVSFSFASGTNVQHDDSVAFQLAINNMATTGGEGFVPVGWYRLNYCNAPGNNNSVLTFPNVPLTSAYIPPVIPIGFVGSFAPGYGPTASQTQSLIQTDCTSGSLWNSPASIGGSGFVDFIPTLDKLEFRSYNNPSVFMLDFSKAAQFRAGVIEFDTGYIPTSAPTHSNGVALATPGPGNYNVNEIGDVMISGYYQDLIAGAHQHIAHAFLTWSLNGIAVNTATDHPVLIDKLDLERVVYGIEPAAGTTTDNITVVEMETENFADGAWTGSTFQIADSSNYLTCEIAYEGTINFAKIGGSHCSTRNLVSGAGSVIGFALCTEDNQSACIEGTPNAGANYPTGLNLNNSAKVGWSPDGYWYTAKDTKLTRQGAALLSLDGATDGDAQGTFRLKGIVESLGGKITTTHGSNATSGVVTLASGTATVSTTSIAALAAAGGAGDVIDLRYENCSSCGTLYTGTVTAGTSFVINSTNASDASIVFWEIRHIN